MKTKLFTKYKEATAFAKRIAVESGMASKVVRDGNGWLVAHPSIDSGSSEKDGIVSGRPRAKEQPEKKSSSRKIALKSTNNAFRFVIRRSTSDTPTWESGPTLREEEIESLVKDYFPNANVNKSIQMSSDAANVESSGLREEYMLVISIRDDSLGSEKFDETLNDLAEELDRFGINY